MTDFPAPGGLPLFVSSMSRWGVALEIGTSVGRSAPVAVDWVANTACYIPVVLPWPYPVQRVWWCNGTTTTTTNVDFGIYTSSGQQLYHTGSTAMGSANLSQYVTPATPFVLPAGTYYFAWTCDNTTARSFARNTATPATAAMTGCLSQTSALPLPATATFATYSAPGIPLCGITLTVSGF